jgi:hypothetical protein
MLPASQYSYTAHRDTHLWKLVFASVMAAVPATMLLAMVAWVLSNPTAREQIPGFLVLVLGSVLGLLLLIGVVFAIFAWKRVNRLRRLTEVGMPVVANVEELKLLYGRSRGRPYVVGAKFTLVYEFQHQTQRVKKKTTLRAAIAQAQSRGQLDLVVDPQDATNNAIVVEGGLS